MKLPALSVKNLTKIFYPGPFSQQKPFTAINNISFDIYPGETVGFLGPNGAGKSTIISILLDTLTPTSGSVHYFGKNISSHRTDILRQIGFASSYSNLIGRLTVYENLNSFAQIYGIPAALKNKRIDELLNFFGIEFLKNRRQSTLSAGQTTRVMLVKAFMIEPKIALLDEPTASLDPDIAFEVRQLIQLQQKQRNSAIIFTSHNMNEVAELCDRVLVINRGTLITQDTPENLARQITITTVTFVADIPDTEKLIELAQSYKAPYSKEKSGINIRLEEVDIAPFLQKVAQKEINYATIAIEKPTLEDYFITLARASRTKTDKKS